MVSLPTLGTQHVAIVTQEKDIRGLSWRVEELTVDRETRIQEVGDALPSAPAPYWPQHQHLCTP